MMDYHGSSVLAFVLMGLRLLQEEFSFFSKSITNCAQYQFCAWLMHRENLASKTLDQ